MICTTTYITHAAKVVRIAKGRELLSIEIMVGHNLLALRGVVGSIVLENKSWRNIKVQKKKATAQDFRVNAPLGGERMGAVDYAALIMTPAIRP